MDIQKIVKGIKSNSEEENRSAIQAIYTQYKLFTEKEVEEITPSIVYYLWKLPKFSVQKDFVLELLANTDEKLRLMLFRHLIREWDTIQLVRMDKFYYLVKRILEYYPLDIETVSYLFDVTHNIGLRSFIVRCVVDRITEIEPELEDFLAEFTSKCPPALLFSLKSLRFSKEVALKYAGSREVRERNRLALYSMIK